MNCSFPLIQTPVTRPQDEASESSADDVTSGISYTLRKACRSVFSKTFYDKPWFTFSYQSRFDKNILKCYICFVPHGNYYNN